MQLDMFPIPQIASGCREINHTENHSDPHHRKVSRANALLKINIGLPCLLHTLKLACPIKIDSNLPGLSDDIY